MPHGHSRLALALAAALLALVGTPLAAFAQAVDIEAVEPEPQDRTGFAFRTGYDHMFRTDVNSGGNVSRDSFQASIGGRFALADKVHFTPRFIYELNAFNISNEAGRDSGFAWGNINQYSLVGIADWAITENWALLGGPMFRLAGEGSGAFDNGFTGGGLLGFNYKMGEDLSVGFGIGVVSQLEDDPAIIPIPMVRWHLAEPLTLKVGIDQLGGRTGLGPELIWHLTKELDFGIGAQYQRRRYRLDDHGGNRKGIGEDSGAPFFARLGWKPMEAAVIEAFVGVVAAGELKTQDKNGNNTVDKGFDATPTLGLRGEYRF
jgi:hypothetical protein